MAGPADYLRITGPLGGANFLNTGDYNTAAKTRNIPVQQTLETVQTFQDIAGGALQNKQRQQAIAAEDKRVQEEATTRQAAAEAVKYGTTLPSFAGAAQVEQTPAPAAPVQAPAQAYPVAPTQAAAAPMQVQTTQAVTSGAPMPEGVQQAAPATAPVAPTTLPPTAVQPAPSPAVAKTVDRVKTLLEVTAKLNSDFDADRAKIQADLQAGRVPPQVAQMVMSSRQALRDAEITRATKFEKEVADISNTYVSSEKTTADTKKANIEAATAARKYEDGNHYSVLTAFEVSPELGVAEARRLGLNPDELFKDGKPTQVLTSRADRSEEGKAQAKAKADEEDQRFKREEADRKRLGLNKLDLATGDRAEVVYDNKGNATGVQYFTGTTPISGAQAQANSLKKAKSVVTSVNVGGSGSRPASGTGEISAIKRDKYGNISVDPTVVKQLAPAAKAYDAARQSLKLMTDIEKSGAVDAASASTLGSAVSGVQKGVGLDTKRRVADERLQRFANSALGVIDSPLMKGAPSEADARRALSVINDSTSSVQTKKEALSSLRTALGEAVAQHEAAVAQYDAPTLQRLKGLGISVEGAEPVAKSTAPVGLKKGDVKNGYVYLGGDPNSQSSWKAGK